MDKYFFIILLIIYFVTPFLIFWVFGVKKKKYAFGNAGWVVKDSISSVNKIPSRMNIYRSFWVCELYDLYSRRDNIMGVIMFKWLKNGNIKLERISKKVFLDKVIVENNIYLVKEPSDKFELVLFNYMLNFTHNGKFEKKEFISWCAGNYYKLIDLFDDVIDSQTEELINEGKVKIEKHDIKKDTIYVVDDCMMLEAEKLAGLRKYLNELSVANEKISIDIDKWYEYIIYALLFGNIAKVLNQFNKFYPEIIEKMEKSGFDFYDYRFFDS